MPEDRRPGAPPPDDEARRGAFARLLKHWRTVRKLSQLALAAEVETTTRHLSYLENGRSRPGRDIVLRIGAALDLPLRSRNELLVAAGLPAEFSESPLEGALLAPYRGAVRAVLTALEPFPAFLVDGHFQLREANAAARRMLAAAPEPEGGAPLNLIDAFLAPGPPRRQIQNLPEVAWAWHARVLRAGVAGPPSAAHAALRERLEGYLRDIPRPIFEAAGDPVLCPTFAMGPHVVRTVGMSMRFGPSRDITLEELTVELLHPRDAEAEAFFRSLA